MKNEYRLLSHPSDRGCPGVIENGDDIVVIGSLLNSEEENDMKNATRMGVSPHERVVRIPRAVFNAAVDKLLTEKCQA